MPRPNTHLCSPFSLQERKIHNSFSFEFSACPRGEHYQNRQPSPYSSCHTGTNLIYRAHQPGTSLPKLKHILRSFISSQNSGTYPAQFPCCRHSHLAGSMAITQFFSSTLMLLKMKLGKVDQRCKLTDTSGKKKKKEKLAKLREYIKTETRTEQLAFGLLASLHRRSRYFLGAKIRITCWYTPESKAPGTHHTFCESLLVFVI